MLNSNFRKLCLGQFEEHKDLIENRAKENIKKYRKGNCHIKFTDKSGSPIIGKKIVINQKKHDFKFGANIFMLDEFDTEEENFQYRNIFHQYFNLATVPFYWKDNEPNQGETRYSVGSPKIYRRPTPDICIKYCEEKEIVPKLHCLVYDAFTPDWALNLDEATLKELYEKRFSEISKRYLDKMYEYEVINEVLLAPNAKKRTVLSSNKDLIDWSFNLARKYFPNKKLLINDANYLPEIGEMGYYHPYYNLIRSALSRGVPIGKIGVQNHIFCGISQETVEKAIYEYLSYFNPLSIIKGLDILSEFKLPLEITEVLIPTIGEDEEAEHLQAEILKYLYTIWFSTPLMESIVYWNTIEGTAAELSPTWNENRCRGFLFKKDFTPKPAAIMIKKLFQEIWHTDLELITDQNGCIEIYGFYGDYMVEIDNSCFQIGIHKEQSNNFRIVV